MQRYFIKIKIYPSLLWWFEWKLSLIGLWKLSPELVVLFGKITKLLESLVFLEEVYHWGGFSGLINLSCSLILSAPYLWMNIQLPAPVHYAMASPWWIPALWNKSKIDSSLGCFCSWWFITATERKIIHL